MPPEPLNEHETIIGVDEDSCPKPLRLFEAWHASMTKLDAEAAKFAQAEMQQRSGKDLASATTTQVASKEYVRSSIAVDMGDIAQRILKSTEQRAELQSLLAGQAENEKLPPQEALAVPTGKPLSIFDPQALPAAYTEFLFGDCVPFLKRATAVTAQQVFDALPSREELEYHLEGDEQPYRANERSRWDTSEFYALFGCTLRSLKLSQSVRAGMERPGFEKDFRVIAESTSQDFVDAALHPSCPRSDADLIRTAGNEKVRTALRHLRFSTATVPFTDGHKMRLHHFGCAMNEIFGPLTVFHTHNYADNYSPEILKLQSSEPPVIGYVQNTLMPTLHQMHQKTAASPRSTAKLFLLMEELSYRHLYRVDQAQLGNFRIQSATGALLREDDYASNGLRGLADFVAALFKCIEAQARGFAHGHGKVHSIPDGTRGLLQCLADVTKEIEALQATGGGAQPAEDVVESIVQAKTQAYNQALIASASTRQYESATLPAKQLGNILPASPFSEKQQRQSRYDGGLEDDGVTVRPLVPVQPAEPLMHLARERRRLDFEHQQRRNEYKEVPLTGCQLCIAPHYLLPQSFGLTRALGDEGEIPDDAVSMLPPLPPWSFDAKTGELQHFDVVSGAYYQHQRVATRSDFQSDAIVFETCFGLDVRFLDDHAHDHDCSGTCVKNVKKKTQDEVAKMLKPNRAPPCRFDFCHIVELVLDDKPLKIRRRGKEIVDAPYVLSTTARNQFGSVALERPQPFRSASSDCPLAVLRCNNDFRYMPKGFGDSSGLTQTTLETLDSHLAACFRAMKAAIQTHAAVRRMAMTVVALHVGAKIIDFYITKYAAKPMEQLQNLVTQYALGLRRLEQEEVEAEKAAAAETSAGSEPASKRTDVQSRSRRVLLRLQHSANRAKWISSTECALYVHTEQQHWTSHNEVPMFTSRALYLISECQRILSGDKSILTRAAAPAQFSVVNYEQPCPPRAGDALLAADGNAQAAADIATAVAGVDATLAAAAADPQAASSASCGALAGACDQDVAPAGADESAEEADGAFAADDADEASEHEEGADETADDADDADEAELGMECPVQAAELRTTCSRHDDWLHRGPFLADLPWRVYMMRVQRARKPTAANADCSQYFLFDKHYALSALYCQEMRYCTNTVIPRLVGSVCPQEEEDNGEPHAAYKLMLFSRARCPGEGHCADPLIFRSLVMPSDKPDNDEIATEKPRFAPCWRACRCEMELKAEVAATKERRAKKIAVLADTIIMKDVQDRTGSSQSVAKRAFSLRPDLLKMIAAQFNKHAERLPHGIVELADCISSFLFGCSLYNVQEQLHLSEFAALEMKKLNDAMNMDLLVRKKPFREENQGGFVNDVDSDAEEGKGRNPITSEFLGGWGEDDDDAVEDTGGDLTVRRQAVVQLSLDECKALLRRDRELERASAPGRHKDADVQMKGYMQTFGSVLKLGLPQIRGKGRLHLPTSLPLGAAADFQRAVAKEMRMQQHDHGTSPEDLAEPSIEDIQQLHIRNRAKDEEGCVAVPLEDALKGPGHVAWKLIQDIKNDASTDFAFNEEQILVIALQIWPLEEAWRLHVQRQQGTTATIATLRKLPNDLGLPRVGIIGGGGCGKTSVMQLVVVPALRTFFSRIVLTAPSNRAARGFDPTAKTLHSISGMTHLSSMRTSSLHIKGDNMRKRLDANQTHAGAWVHDEALQTSAPLLHAAALRTTYARQHHYKLETSRYAHPNEIMGKISFFALCGDHLQLPPVPKTSGLLAPLENTSDEHKAGASIFINIQYLFEMETMKRFTDPTLVSILAKMRQTNGAKLSEQEWQALLDTEVDAEQVERDPDAFLQDTHGWFESSYLWSIVSMACYSRAMASARQHKQTLFFCQAVDFSEQVSPRDCAVYQRMLAVPSVAHTGRLPAMVLLHIGMRVRMTTQVLPPWAVQDATGTVMEIAASPGDKRRMAASDDAHAVAEMRLEELPPGVYVKLDKCEREFLPPTVCHRHRQAGYSSSCGECRAFEGWVLVEPMRKTWTFTDPVTGATLQVSRTQLPLMPADACPLYSLQGATCDPGLIAHFVMPRRADDDIKWLIIYVLLSRVRGLSRLRSIGLKPAIRKIIEGGPPTMLAENFERLFREKIQRTKQAAEAAKAALGWH